MKDKIGSCVICHKEIKKSESLRPKKYICSTECNFIFNDGRARLFCEVCNKQMKKKNSIMKGPLVCSNECFKIRKDNLPKHLGILTTEYWINQGYSLQEATNIIIKDQRQRSPRCVEHWIKLGYSEVDAKTEVANWQSKCGLRNQEIYTKEEIQGRNKWCYQYWLNLGYTIEEAKFIIAKNSDNASLDFYILQFGKEEGLLLYKERCKSIKYYNSFEYFKLLYGSAAEKLWSEKYSHSGIQSEIAKSVIFEIYSRINRNAEYDDNIYFFNEELAKREFGRRSYNSDEYFFYDFVMSNIKYCIEFNGDFWHANPSVYGSDDEIIKKTAQELWDKDRRKQQTLENDGFVYDVIWENKRRYVAEFENEMAACVTKINKLLKDKEKLND